MGMKKAIGSALFAKPMEENSSTEPMKQVPHTLGIQIPADIINAATLIDDWARSHGIVAYQIQGVCSIAYANAIRNYVPALRKLRHHPNGINVIEAHNAALAKLKTFVPSEGENNNHTHN